MSEPSSPAHIACVVLDTNIVLDLLVFQDPATLELNHALRAAITRGQARWLVTPAMREELERVLAYPQVFKRMAFYGRTAAQVLAEFDQLSVQVAPAPKASVTCKDPDDQQFIDLAVTHRATLLSKDHAVLCMAKRMAALGVPYVGVAWGANTAKAS